MVRRTVRRTCLLCKKCVDARLVILTHTQHRNTVFMLSSLVLFNEIDLTEAKRCYETNKRKRLCDQHFIDATMFFILKLTSVRIRVTSYMDSPLCQREESISYVKEEEIPHCLFDSLKAIARKLNESLDLNLSKFRDFLNGCLYRHISSLRSTLSAAHSQQEDTVFVTNTDYDAVGVKSDPLLCGTSNTSVPHAVGQDHSTEENCVDHALQDAVDVKPVALLCETSSANEFTDVGQDHSTKEKCVDYALKDAVDVKPGVLLCETSSATEFIDVGQYHSTEEKCVDHALQDAVDVKPVALLCGTSSATEFTDEGQDGSIKDEDADSGVKELDESDPDLLERIIPVRGDCLLSLLRFCPKCGTRISRKRRIVLSEVGPPAVAYYFCNSCGGERCWDVAANHSPMEEEEARRLRIFFSQRSKSAIGHHPQCLTK
ncbi:hypothetical protein Y032_0410g944 [Ancylostoma ceylanicum]|uniref:Uncharacterized protein n=1 Tax=Ancylostoma ceylanicum TaxID=53326 RepID=A0A016X4A5_9BILA|nr:hypothetical protein Y032_0410g944 [Ancylostoma ceylanicum]